MQKDCHFAKVVSERIVTAVNALDKSKIYPKSNILSNPKRLEILDKYVTNHL